MPHVSTAPDRSWIGKTVVFVGGVVVLAALGLFVSHWAVRYGAGLTAFTLWMWWFVSVGVDWIGAATD
jgi:hypothetical protein